MDGINVTILGQIGVKMRQQFVLENRTDFLLILLERVDSLGVYYVLRVFGKAPCCFGGATVSNEGHGVVSHFLFTINVHFFYKIRIFLLIHEVFISFFYFFNSSILYFFIFSYLCISFRDFKVEN